MIIGHQKQWRFLKNSFFSDRLSHGYLFSGPQNVGKRTVALEWVKFLHCQEPNTQNRPCGFCPGCRMVSNNTHPDAVVVEPEPQKKEIQISQIRELIYKLFLKPSLSPLKTAIVDRADLMNPHAQNCLLKTLEEPEGHTLLILIASHPEALFETIRSRVQKIRFRPVPRKEIEDFLRQRGLFEQKIVEIVRLSLGRPGRMLELLENPQKLKKEQKQTEEFVKILHSDLGSRFQYADALSKKPLKDILEAWVTYFREFLLFKTGALKETTFLPDFFPNFSLAQIKIIIEHLETIFFLISTKNVNKRLALEMLMMNT